jgi:rare lipoprotein A
MQVASAAPRAQVASDSLPPPPGTRATSIAGAALPPPSATLPPVEARPTKGKGRAAAQPVIARPAPPVVAQPAQSAVPARQQPAAPSRPVTPLTEVAALPVPQQPAATAVVTQTAVEPTSIFIQAGAFANYDNAHRMSVRLSRYGRAKVTPVSGAAQQLFRVRLGPIGSVQEADSLLAEVAVVVPEARIVVD